MLGTRKCLGNGVVTGKGQRELLAFRETQAGISHSYTDSFPQGRDWITPVLCTERGERVGTGCASTAKDHLLDLGLTPRYEDLNTSPVQPGWTQFEMPP